jgi:hypothetical protein
MVAAVSKLSRASTSVDTPGHHLEDLRPKRTSTWSTMDVQRLAPVRGHRLGQQRRVLRLLHRLEDQRRVGGGVARRECASW